MSTNNTKIVHLTSAHPVFDTRIFHKMCKSSAAAGYNVTLIAQHECDEIVDGVRIRALPAPRGRLDRMLRITWRAYRLARAEHAALYHFHDPELMLTGWMLKLGGARVVYDVHEDYPQTIRNKFYLPHSVRAPLAALMRLLEAITARMVSGIAAATPHIARRFPNGKTVTIQNFPDERAASPTTSYTRRPLRLVYVGAMSEARGIRELVDAVALLDDPSLELVLAGSFRPAVLEDELRQRPGWSWVCFRGWLDRAAVRDLLSSARVGLVPFHPEPNHIEAKPNKLFEYMAAGLPVIASDFPLWRQIVEGAGCGLLVDPMDPHAIASAIEWLLEHPDEAEAMGQSGREAVRDRYNWEAEGQKLLAFYERILTV